MQPTASLPDPSPDDHARWRMAVVDALLAAAYAGIFIGYSVVFLRSKLFYLPWTTPPELSTGPLQVALHLELVSYTAFALVIIYAAGLAIRRTYPRASFTIIAVATLVQLAVGEPLAFWNIALPASLFSVAAYGGRTFARVAILALVAAYVLFWAGATGLFDRLDLLSNPLPLLATTQGAVFVASLALLVLVWSFGDQVGAARERSEFERERAIQLERERTANAQLEALAERHRIARELHDVVAHGLSVMIVQADGARYAADEHPEAPIEALGVIATTGRESLTEMRRLLGVLRGAEEPDLAPQPDLAAVARLVDGFREAGLPVDLALPDPLPGVPAAVGLAAYRVVQESLTNVLRHAGRVPAAVSVAVDRGWLAVRVVNEGGVEPVQSPQESAGLGLTGMTERVRLLGGRLAAGPRAGGGFEVAADLPLA